MISDTDYYMDAAARCGETLDDPQFADDLLLGLLKFCTPPDDKSMYHTITQEQYQEFEEYLIFDLLAGKRFGQAFCERFGIANSSPLYHFHGREVSERWIRDNYLVKNETEVR
jgi:hypothetical protein